MKARLTPDRTHVELQGKRWSDRWPVECLPGWLKFYRRMRDRCKHGTYTRYYAETVAELERIQAELNGPTLPGGGGGAAARVA